MPEADYSTARPGAGWPACHNERVSDERGPAWTGALQDFWRARRRARLREVLAGLTRNSRPLLNFEQVRRQLRAVESAGRELTEVPLDRIVGSVGRYNDFTREFLPRQDSDSGRWARVRMAMTGLEGVPPVELYRIGDAYFVKDGNHRVSVARQLGHRYIHAYVTPLHTRVHLGPDVSPERLIIKAEQAEFLEKTRIDELRPGAELSVTAAGRYGQLLEHIDVHRYFMGLDEQRDVSFEEAVVHWYDTVYLPVVELIRRHDLLTGFEGRTETDLYLFLSEHRGRLWRELGFQLPAHAVASELTGRNLNATPAARARLLEQARAGKVPGLYHDVLVGLTGSAADDQVFGQALRIAHTERTELYVLDMAGVSAEARASLQERARAAGVAAQFVTTFGDSTEELLDRSEFSGLVVMQSARSVQGLVRRLRRPLLLVAGDGQPLSHVLLAFDGSRRSEEAMFHAAYLKLTRTARLTVVTVQSSARTGRRILDSAAAYLEGRGVEADYVRVTGPVVTALLETARERDCDLIALGSYKYSAWLETVLGGVPDELIVRSDRNLLIA